MLGMEVQVEVSEPDHGVPGSWNTTRADSGGEYSDRSSTSGL